MTKVKFDNKYGTRHSLIDGINRGTDVLIAARTFSSAASATSARAAPSRSSGQGARVSVTEIDPINALQALMEASTW